MAKKRKEYKIKISKIKKFLEKLVLAVARHLFLGCLVIFLFVAVLGGFFYYKYNILVQMAEIESLEKPFLLEKNNYQDVIKFWQENEKRFKEADSKEYIDPFLEVVPFPGEQ